MLSLKVCDSTEMLSNFILSKYFCCPLVKNRLQKLGFVTPTTLEHTAVNLETKIYGCLKVDASKIARLFPSKPFTK